MAAVNLSYRATQQLDFKICFEESSPNTLATTREIEPADETKDALLERGSDTGDSHEGEHEYDTALVRLSATLNDPKEELCERTALIVDGWIESHLVSESQESAQEIWYDICALQRKVQRLASHMLQPAIGFQMRVNKPNSKDYTVGWICTGTMESAAVYAFLDERHEVAEDISPNDDNVYILGVIGKHKVVITVLTDRDSVTAADAARNMDRSFTNLRIRLLVGIGGGVPSKRHDIRLGDVVVSAPSEGMGGVTGFGLGGTIQDPGFRQIGFLNKPPNLLLAAANHLRSTHAIYGNSIEKATAKVLGENSRLQMKYSRPDPSSDRLFPASFAHAMEKESCWTCDNSFLIPRNERASDEDEVTIHLGLIASINPAIHDATFRDQLAAEYDILCFDTVAAGVMNGFPCLVIHGIYNYSDSHRNDEWAGYAAMTAAAYAKELLYQIVPESDDK